MLRPEQMSKVSVTGSKGVMTDVIETIHDLNLLHMTDYDGSWEGFTNGDPIEGAEDTSDKLVTVRAIESILDVDEDDAGPSRIVTDEALEAELDEIRDRVNELDDRRDEVRSELREVEERLDNVEPFAALGIDMDLLSGYDTLEVAVGHGDRDAVERAVVDAEDLAEHEIFEGDGDVIAVFARPADGADEDALSDALVGVEFAGIEVPDAEGSPEEYVRDLQSRKQKLENDLDDVDNDLEEVRLDAAGFLLAAEETLSIDVQKAEAPLSFATTENAFIAEGWIPSERYTDFANAIADAVGDRVEVEEVERAAFKTDGTHVTEEVPPDAATATADGGDEVRADGGGNVVMRDDSPPVIQSNDGAVRAFEVLTRAVGRPKYTEFDPTVILFLTFPAFFGFMIGDLGYGIIYTAIGYYLYTSFESDAFRSMGGVTIASGLFTMLFGILYGEIFGLHLIAEYLWHDVVGLAHAPIEKGLSPATGEWALAWLVVSVLVGILHLNVGYVIDFVENVQLHDVKHALYESASWILMLNGIWIWIFSESAASQKPEFVFTVFSGEPFALGFAGFPATVGLAGFVVFLVGAVLLALGEPIEVIEVLNVIVNALSYTRLAAVLLAKAGMAFAVNLLFFGVGAEATDHGAEWHFLLFESPEHFLEVHEGASILFPGLVHSGVAGVLGGLLVLVLGHALVLALGVTSAGLQAVRLEYVEFFGKFYQGGGREYLPFGYERRYTTDD